MVEWTGTDERKCHAMGLRKKKSLTGRASDYVESAKPQIESAVATAKDRATPLLSQARDKAAPVISDARDKAAPVISDARDKAAPLFADAREKVAPLVADARTKAGPVIAEGAAVAADKAALGAALAAEKAAIGRDLANAKAVELRKEGRKGGKLKKLLLFGGLAAAAGVAYKKFSGQSASDNWQSSYTPSPAPSGAPSSSTEPSTSTPPVATEPGDDPAGSSPDEALADSAGEPHPVSTPDNPAEVVDLDETKGSKPSHKA
jgi:vacuolar-type H+-ATPase subunit H